MIQSLNHILISLFLYNTGLFCYGVAVRISSLFNTKARRFITGRKLLLPKIALRLQGDNRKKIWIHCASLGEFEQGRPVIESIKQNRPDLSIVLTFFSPSGYEAKKNYKYADHIFYLPLDSRKHATRFVAIVKPECALFVKYEFWYYYLLILHQHNIPTILFSAIFQQRHPFFKWYGNLHRKMLSFYDQIFVQDKTSLALLERIHIIKVQIAGDTRFDRSAKVLEMDKSFHTIATFKEGHKLLVAGSTWYEDEILLQKTLRDLPEEYKLLIAPHEIHEENIVALQQLFPNESCLWATDEETFRRSRVCIIHTIGQLSYLYKYADAAWIGGGFTRSGIHNIIEPAVFGVPVFFGPNYQRYREANEMIMVGAAQSLSTSDDLTTVLQNEKALLHMGNNAEKYVQEQLGATSKIMAYLTEKCLPSIP